MTDTFCGTFTGTDDGTDGTDGTDGMVRLRVRLLVRLRVRLQVRLDGTDGPTGTDGYGFSVPPIRTAILGDGYGRVGKIRIDLKTNFHP